MRTRHTAVIRPLVGVVALAGSLVACLAGCMTVTTAAPPLVVCGTTLSRSAAGPVILDISHGGRVTNRSIGGEVFLRVSDDCDHGTTVRWSPASAASEVEEARSGDGRLAAIVLRPNADRFTVTLASGTGRTDVEVDLPPKQPVPTPTGID